MGVATAAAIGSAVVGAYSANRSAQAARSASNSATAEQRRQFDLARQDQQPWLQAGGRALNQLEQLNAGNYQGFMNSPDYLAAQEMGMKALDRSAAARGRLYGGGADADRIRLGQQLATQNLNNYSNRLMGLAGAGQNSAQSLGSLGANAANQIGANMMNAGAARASAYQQQGQAFSNLLSGLGGYYGGYGVGGKPGKG